MLKNIEIELEEVNSVITSAIRIITDNQEIVNEKYESLASQFQKSTGETAEGLRELHKLEQQLVEDMSSVIIELANTIDYAANEFARLDREMKKTMDHGSLNVKIRRGAN